MTTALVFGSLLTAQTPTNPPSQQQPPTGIASPDVNAVPAKPANAPNVSATGRRFLRDAAMGGMTEVELGTLAAEKASTDAVKKFAAKMVADHSKAGADLKQLAAAKNIDLPGTVDSSHKSRIKKLSKLSGASFEKAYIQDQLDDHRRDVAQFQEAATTATDPAIKEFATKTLPELKAHLALVEELSPTYP